LIGVSFGPNTVTPSDFLPKAIFLNKPLKLRRNRMKRRHIVGAFVVVACLLLASTTWAQTDTGRIVGTVTDSTGGVIPGVTVTATSEKTGAVRSTVSDEKGFFVLTPLPAATYTVKADQPGFSGGQYTGIIIQVGQEKTLNLQLKPAGVTSEVTVSGGELTTIDTSSARVGVNVSEREVNQLPLNGRQVSGLYLMTPGAVNYGAGTFDDVRFSGRSVEQNEVRYDGVEGTSIVDTSPGNLNGQVASPFRLQTSMENVQEFRVESSNYPAEYGTGTGGQISVITKSGANTVHGSVFEYIRNNALDARNFFDGSNKSKLRLNQFGASLGGPIVQNKGFFFGSYEGLRQRAGIPFVETTPSASAWARAVPAIQPLRGVFPVGQIPSSNPDLDIVRVEGNAFSNENTASLRLDYNFSEKYRMYVRYMRDQGIYTAPQNSSLSIYTLTAVPQNAVWNLQQILSPSIINETKVGLNAAKTRTTGIGPTAPGVDLGGAALVLGGSVALSGAGGTGAGSAGITIPTGLVRANSATNGRGQPYTNYTLSFIDNLSLIKKSHTMKFGFEARPVRMKTDRLGGITYTYSNVGSFLANTPSSIQFLGDVSATSPFTGKSGPLELDQAYYIGYAQDEWKATPTVTISYGMRYEFYSALHEINNHDVYFDMETGTLGDPTEQWYQTSANNWGPRLGISWSPAFLKNKTVFRLGGGLFYGPGQTEDQLQPAESDRVSTTITSGPNLAYPLNTQAVLANYNINDSNLQFQPRAYAPGYRIPERIGSYTFSIQQDLGKSTVLTVAYVGSQGRNLFLRSVTNKIVGVATNPTTGAAIVTREFGNRFAEIDYKTSGGTSHYDSLQTTLNRRFSGGLTLGSQYTWSHNIGDTGGSNEANTASNNFNFQADRGNNTFDVRHSFNFSTLYEVPFGKGRKFLHDAGPAADAILGGWQLGGIVNARSGLPIEVLITRPDVVYRDNRDGSIVASPILVGGVPVTTAIINVPGGGNSRNIRRPDLVPGVNPIIDNGTLAYINPAAFSTPAPGTFGNLGRNALHGPHFGQLDMTLSKKFQFAEKRNIEFRSEFYNILNHANFALPGSTRLANALGTGTNQIQPGQAFTAAAAGGNYGVLTSTVANQVGIGTNRQIQFALRINY
jgi:hypothetical protein